LRTYYCGDFEENSTKPVLVFIHGFASSGPFYFKMFEALLKEIDVIFVDLPGMGSSSVVDDFDKDKIGPKEVTEYFVEYLEKWRVAVNITNFYILGHSYGGFIAGHYATKYHQHIKKLILMSPVGIRGPKEHEKKT
jgi:abhydrolase domain-containing protein 5